MKPTKLSPVKTPAEIAAVFGCSEAQARKQLERNRSQLLAMLARARCTGKPVNGCTDAWLSNRIQSINSALSLS